MNHQHFFYCRETNAMVPLMKASLQTPPRMQGSWSNNTGTLEATVELFRGVDSEPSPSVEGSPQYYHK